MKTLEVDLFSAEHPYGDATQYGAIIRIDGKFFKEITGLHSPIEVLKAIASNEDVLSQFPA